MMLHQRGTKVQRANDSDTDSSPHAILGSTGPDSFACNVHILASQP